VIRYCLILLLLTFVLLPSVDAQEGEPALSAAQQGDKTVFLLSANWTSRANEAELVLSSSSIINSAAASKWWQVTQTGQKEISFRLTDGATTSSIFIINSNSSDPTFRYELALDSTKYSGTIDPIDSEDAVWFQNWADGRENATSAFVPRGWTADLQIIRPYNSMTGFVFFMRGPDNALAYVFYPFMPLHLLPDEEICKALGTCSGIASAEIVRKASFGNAPVAVSELKNPTNYFESEVLPLLRSNLDGYAVESADPLYALRYDGNNQPNSKFLQGLELNYGFDAPSKRIVGKAVLLISNQTEQESGYWNGVIVGVESSEATFDKAFQQASVTLLTLGLGEKWMNEEQAVLDQNIAESRPQLLNVSRTIANSSLQEFDSVVSSAAHALVRSYDESRIGAFIDTATGKELHLPLYQSTQNWYLQDGQLVGRKVGRNILNDTSLELLWR
jgi:hypothetical protein